MDNLPTETIYITGKLPTWTSFGMTSNHEAVYVPSNVAKAVQIEVGGAYEASLAPNSPDKAERVPWMVVHITPPDEDDFADVTEALSEYECPIEAQHLSVSPGRIEKAWRKGKIVRVEARQSPHAEPVILWAHSMEVL